MTTATTMPVSLFGLNAGEYEPHALHAGSRTYFETNCYTDILVELVHARGDEPLAMLGFLTRMDFEGDQWTFFKPPPADLEELYGIDIHEMQPYRPVAGQMAEQIELGRTMIVELDAWFLPDTASTSYRTAHVKTSAAIEGIDLAGERLSYFHNTALHELEGEDYRSVLRVEDGWHGEVLPPYAELVRFDAGPRLRGDELRAAARALLAGHLARRPPTNPFERFGHHLAAELPVLVEGGEREYHDYVFATLRMAGSSFEVLGSHLRWLLDAEADEPVAALERVVAGCKLLSFKLARRRAFDTEPRVAELAAAWDDAMVSLDGLVG